MSTFNERTSSGVSINGYIIKESLILFRDALIVINLLRSVLEMSTNLFCVTGHQDDGPCVHTWHRVRPVIIIIIIIIPFLNIALFS